MVTTKPNPVTAGVLLVEEFPGPLGMSQTDFAEHSGLPRKHVNELCRDRRAVTADTALILARVFGNSADFLAEHPAAYRCAAGHNTPARRLRIERAKPLRKRAMAEAA